jgi:hypothetical protein
VSERRAGYVRIRHYTNRSGSERIEAEGVIRRAAHGAVFCENARRAPLAPHDVEARHRIGRGRGRDYIEVLVPRPWVVRRVNASTGAEEWLVHRDIPLDPSATIVRRH